MHALWLVDQYLEIGKFVALHHVMSWEGDGVVIMLLHSCFRC
jgi:hypothetical protein